MSAAARPILSLRNLLLFLCFLGVALPEAAPAAGDAATILYRVRKGDTLIGIGSRLLVPPAAWREVAVLNHIVRTNRLVPESTLIIPMGRLRWTPQDVTVEAVSDVVLADNRPVSVGERLHQGARIDTGVRGSVALRLGDGSVIRATPGTTLLLTATQNAAGTEAPDIRIELPEGNVAVSAQKHRDIGRFEIRTPTAVTAVRGTEYRAHFKASEVAAVSETLSGVIEVSAAGTAIPVAGGMGTRAEADRAPIAPVPLLPGPDLSGLPPSVSAAQLRFAFRPVAGAQRYRVQLASEPHFQSVEAEVIAEAPVVDLNGIADGEHWLSVRSIDPLGIEGRDSIATFHQHTLPDTPVPAEPAEAADGVGATAMFRWTGAAAAYRFELCQVAECESSRLQRDVDRPELSLSPIGPGRYSWRVAALSAAGESGPWSEWHFFAQHPSPPALERAQIGRHRVVQLSWPVQSSYKTHLQIARDPEFSHIVRETTSSEGSASFEKLRMGRYYARIRYESESGFVGAFGPTLRFGVPPPVWVWPLAAVLVSAIWW